MAILLLVFGGVSAGTASAQPAPRVEIEAGPGYAVGGGNEDPAPTLGTIAVGGTWWLSESWGVGVTFVTTYGIERFGRTQRSGDRTWIGRGELHYVRYQACRRHRLSPGWNLEYGFGLTEHASFNILGDLDTPSGVRRIKSPTWFSAFAGEVSIRRALGQHFGVRAGVMLDGNIETTIVHPVVSAVVAF